MEKKIGKPKNRLLQLQILKFYKEKNRSNYELFYIKLNNEYRSNGN